MFYLSCLIGELLLFDLEQGPRCWLFSSHFDYSCPGGWLNRHRCWIPANQRPPLYFQGSTRLWLCITRLLPNIATKRITNGGWWTWQHFYGKYDVSVNVNDLVSGWWVWITSIVFQLCTCTGWWFGSCFIFPYVGNNTPNWRTHIFQRGRYTTNQCILFTFGMRFPNWPMFYGWNCRGSSDGPQEFVFLWSLSGWTTPGTLWSTCKKLRKITMFNGKIHYKWSC